MTLEDRWAVERASVERFEVECRLPALAGTERQRVWGRMIRWEFLAEAFGSLLDATRGLGPDAAAAVYRCLDRLRAVAAAKTWIEQYRPHLGRATEFLLGLPAAEAAERERAEQAALRQREAVARSIESNRLNREAADFEAEHDLPDLIGGSIRQVNFGRRCRYQYLRSLTPEGLAAVSPLVARQLTPGYWIGSWTTGKPLEDLVRGAADRPPGAADASTGGAAAPARSPDGDGGSARGVGSNAS